jgi:hypothetical protein
VPGKRLLSLALVALMLAGCSNVGNMFSGRGPDRPFDTRTTPDVRETLKGKPEGLVADRENARHTGLPLEPQ